MQRLLAVAKSNVCLPGQSRRSVVADVTPPRKSDRACFLSISWISFSPASQSTPTLQIYPQRPSQIPSHPIRPHFSRLITFVEKQSGRLKARVAVSDLGVAGGGDIPNRMTNRLVLSEAHKLNAVDEPLFCLSDLLDLFHSFE